jgi:hypothetical protein
MRRAGARIETVPVFTDDSLDEGGAQLCPCGIATATPQHYTMASKTDNQMPAPEFPTRPTSGLRSGRCAPHPAHIHQVRAGRALRDVNAGSSRTPLHHARRTHTIWQYWRVPALSGPLPPTPAPPGAGCPQLQRPAATGRRCRPSTSTQTVSASRRTQLMPKTMPTPPPVSAELELQPRRSRQGCPPTWRCRRPGCRRG